MSLVLVAKSLQDYLQVKSGVEQKYLYHQQKVVWAKIAELIRGGHTADTAIDLIYETYGINTSPVTIIINQMQRDWQTGGHPNLHV